MVTRILPVFLLLLAVSCSKDEPDYEHGRTSFFKNLHEVAFDDTVLVCVTFNIHLGFRAYDDPWNKDASGADEEQVKNIARLLKKVNPGIIALQEVPLNRYNAVIKDFLAALAAEMDMNYAFGSHGYNDPYGIYPVYGEWGTAILTKYHILDITNTEVEYISKWEKRSMLDATIEVRPGEKIHAISLHYIPSDQGIPNTAGYLSGLTGPVIMMGDFNYLGDIPAFSALGIRDADTAGTIMGIDRIFYSGNHLRSISFGTILDSCSWISDHPANYAILAWNALSTAKPSVTSSGMKSIEGVNQRLIRPFAIHAGEPEVRFIQTVNSIRHDGKQ